jgi:hypothetical protein
MILCHTHRFLFVRTLKVAGTSVEMVLSTLCDGRDIATAMLSFDERTRQAMGGFSGNYSDSPAAEQLYARAVQTANAADLPRLKPPPERYIPHMGVEEVVAFSGIDPSAYRVVAVERDPYARLLSFLHMRRHGRDYRASGAMPERPGDLAETMDEAMAKGALWQLRSRVLYGEHMPELLRYETLQSDLDRFAASLGVTLPSLPHAKQGVLASTIDPRELLRRDQLDWFNDYCAREFAEFGYATV